MGMRPARTLAARRRYRLKHLGSADPAEEDAMRIGCQSDAHGVVAGCEDGFAEAAAQRRGKFRISAADANVDLQGAEPEIEQDAIPIFIAQRVGIGADLCQLRTAVHGADRAREAQRQTMAPGLGGRRLRGDEAQLGVPHDAQAAASRYHADAVIALSERYGLSAIAREFGDSAECAEADARLNVGELVRQNGDESTSRRHMSLPFDPALARTPLSPIARDKNVSIAPLA